MGSGNHFLEIQRVDEIYDPATANVMGIQDIGQVLVMSIAAVAGSVIKYALIMSLPSLNQSGNTGLICPTVNLLARR